MIYRCNICGKEIDEDIFESLKDAGNLTCKKCEKAGKQGQYQPFDEEKGVFIKVDETANYSDLEKRIINTYPMPIAIGLKTLLNAKGNLHAEIDYTMDLYTNLLKYIGIIL